MHPGLRRRSLAGRIASGTGGRPNLVSQGTRPTGRTEITMRIGTSVAEPTGPDALVQLADQLRAAAADGFASAWMSRRVMSSPTA